MCADVARNATHRALRRETDDSGLVVRGRLLHTRAKIVPAGHESDDGTEGESGGFGSVANYRKQES
jgi:hypothetical protein